MSKPLIQIDNLIREATPEEVKELLLAQSENTLDSEEQANTVGLITEVDNGN